MKANGELGKYRAGTTVPKITSTMHEIKRNY